MIKQGDNFRLVEGVEAEASLAAHFAMVAKQDGQERPPTPAPGPRPDRAGEPWSSQEDVHLRNMYRDCSDETVGTLLGRTGLAVRCRRGILNLRKSSWL